VSLHERSFPVVGGSDGGRGRSQLRDLWAVPATLATTFAAWRWVWFVHPDWVIARRAGGMLLSADGLSVYARNPRAQMGPLALLAAQLPHRVYVPVVAATVGLFLVWALDAAAPGARSLRQYAVAVACSLLLIVPWSQLAWKGHADDALVLLGTAWCLRSLRRGRTRSAVIGYAVAVASKPTALVLLPLLLSSAPAVMWATAVTGAVWLPFFVSDPSAMLHAGRGVMRIAHGSFPQMLGYPVGAAPAWWIRFAQFGLGLFSVAWGTRVGRPALGVLLAFAIRAALDPNPAPAYCIGLVAVALVPDAAQGLPVFCGLASAAFWLSQPGLDGGPAWPRATALACLAVAIVATLGWRGWKRPPSSDDGP
jgi:hypothetical protein